MSLMKLNTDRDKAIRNRGWAAGWLSGASAALGGTSIAIYLFNVSAPVVLALGVVLGWIYIILEYGGAEDGR